MTIDTKELRELYENCQAEAAQATRPGTACFNLGVAAHEAMPALLDAADRLAQIEVTNRRLMDDMAGASVALGLDFTTLPVDAQNPLTAKAREVADRLAALEAENQRLQDSLASYVVEWIDSIKDEEGSRGAYSCDICGAENAHDPDWVDHKPTCVIKSKVAGL